MAKRSDSHPPYKPAVILKELREQVGMTQTQLGKLAGFSRDDIANFERGGTGAGSLITIQDALKCYEALATEDKSGDATSAALRAATVLVDSARDNCEQVKQRLAEARVYLKKCRVDEKRIKALKRKSFPRHKANERFLVRPFPKKFARQSSLFQPLR